MGWNWSSHELASGDGYQLAFPRESCPSCEDFSGCPYAGTTYQCWAIPVLEGDTQPCTAEAPIWIQQLNRLDIRARGSFASPTLPELIPRVEPQSAAGPATGGLSWVALSPSGFLRGKGSRVRTKEDILRATGMDASIKTMLVFTGKDETLATLGRARSELIKSIRSSGHDLVLSPHFSLWEKHSAFHSRVQIAYIDRFGSDLAEAGIPTVPVACWYEGADMDDLAAAVNANPSIRVMWLDWQKVPHGPKWRRRNHELQRLAELMPAVRFIVNGVGSPRREDLLAKPYVMSVVSSHEFVAAVRGNKGPDAQAAAQHQLTPFLNQGDAGQHRSSPQHTGGVVRHVPVSQEVTAS